MTVAYVARMWTLHLSECRYVDRAADLGLDGWGDRVSETRARELLTTGKIRLPWTNPEPRPVGPFRLRACRVCRPEIPLGVEVQRVPRDPRGFSGGYYCQDGLPGLAA